jgi:hypothetical protein
VSRNDDWDDTPGPGVPKIPGQRKPSEKTTCVGCHNTFHASPTTTRSGWPLCSPCLTGRHNPDQRITRLLNNDAYELV